VKILRVALDKLGSLGAAWRSPVFPYCRCSLTVCAFAFRKLSIIIAALHLWRKAPSTGRLTAQRVHQVCNVTGRRLRRRLKHPVHFIIARCGQDRHAGQHEGAPGAQRRKVGRRWRHESPQRLHRHIGSALPGEGNRSAEYRPPQLFRRLSLRCPSIDPDLR
jgi:hypothetical protein